MEEHYIHVARYGNMGEKRIFRPQYVVRGKNVYATRYNRSVPQNKALFTIKNHRWYRTAFHPDGKSIHPMYIMKGDRIHTTRFHAEHDAGRHVFESRARFRV